MAEVRRSSFSNPRAVPIHTWFASAAMAVTPPASAARAAGEPSVLTLTCVTRPFAGVSLSSPASVPTQRSPLLASARACTATWLRPPGLALKTSKRSVFGS